MGKIVPYVDREKQREYQRIWASKRKSKATLHYRELRERVLVFLGNKCVHCGCTIKGALEINHRNGGGRKEKKEYYGALTSRSFYYDILSGRRKIDDLELTCRICNAYHYLKIIKKIPGEWKIEWNETPITNNTSPPEV